MSNPRAEPANAARPGWERAKELLHQAMQLEPEQRTLFLDQACPGDDALRAEVESLLCANEGVRSSFLQGEKPIGPDGAETGRILAPGQIFAQRFLLVRKLGEGGMGQVWLAEQTEPVRRQVALKLIKAGMYDETIVQRFQSERQSLAIMDHPGIAKVFDAGATPQGQPYFVMEYVDGQPITDYCDQKKLTIAQRLELFIQVCEAVQHAHQKAIIHRDLKPANILLVEVDGKPVPRIIDFGLAKATTPTTDDTLTQFGLLVGTPGYMSPEQADPNVRDIDTRTDVYSLGVVLYVLLTGLQPFDAKQWKDRPLDELLRRLREQDAPSPSHRVSSSGDTSTATAEARGAEAKQLVRMLRGDLDWITMKALERDRSRRYGTPSELAADLRRYLNHEPVVARPASTGYQLRKYVRRHRVAVGVAAGLVLLLAAFSVAQTLQLRRITRERDRADRERDRATRITDFMTGMFKVSDPSEARGNSVTAREILDKASKDIGGGLAKDPEAQAQMLSVMARTYTNLGLYPRAHELAQRALDARMKLLGPNDPATLESMSQMATVLMAERDYSQAEKLKRQALEGQLRVLGPEDPRTLESMTYLAGIVRRQGHYDEAEKLQREVVEIETRTLGAEDIRTLRSVNNLGTTLNYEGRYADSEPLYRKLLEVDRRVLGPDSPDTIFVMGNLALATRSEGRLAESERSYRDLLAAFQRVLGPDAPNTIAAMDNLADLLIAEGRFPEAEKLYRDVVQIRLRTVGPQHPVTLLSRRDLVILIFLEGHIHEAEESQREILVAQQRILGPENPDTLSSGARLAQMLIGEGKYAEAEQIVRKSFDIQLRTLGPQDGETVASLRQLGKAMAYSHRYPEASSLFRDVIEKQKKLPVQANPWTVWYSYACVAAVANQEDDALEYLRQAFHRGYDGYTESDRLLSDDDLKNLRQNPHFQELEAALRSPALRSKLPE